MGLFSRIRSYFTRPPCASLEEAEAVVDRLIELGFLKFVPDLEKEKIRAQLVESVQNRHLDSEWNERCHSADKRTYQADNEDLAEGDVGQLILEMKEALNQEGVRLESVEDEFGMDVGIDYQVVINGTAHVIYDVSRDTKQNLWDVATRRLLEIVNSLLQEAGSRERLYAISGGNDGRVILLTPEMHDLLMANEAIFDNDWLPRPASAV